MSNFVTMDGNAAAANVAYDFTEIAAIYPITPSSPMAGLTDQWSANGRLNMFDQPVKLIEMQSEAGAIGAVHGALQTGSLGVSYTSSQGLMLMVPVLYRIAGERLPAVLHVAARTVGTHGMSIFGDHSDVMACRATGFAMLCSGSVQEAADLAAVAHLAAVKGRTPFMHFFDGFRTSHELSRIDMPDVKALTKLMDKDALQAFRDHALNPEHPRLWNTVQNGDVYFQIREANNGFYDDLPEIVEYYLEETGKVTGRTYHLFDYYGDPDAEDVVIAMGSVSGAAKEAVDYLSGKGKKVGYLEVHLYRPFSSKHFLNALPKSVKRIAVLDRCKEMGSVGEPLYLDVVSVIKDTNMDVSVIGGRYGLSSKDTDMAQLVSVYKNLSLDNPKKNFTIGIVDDVTHLSLEYEKITDYVDNDTYSCKFWGLGGDGTVGANHNTAKILGDCEDLYSQAYFEYDAKKSFGITKSHLRFSKKPIRSTYYVKSADFVACHNENFIGEYDIVNEIKKGGSLLLNCSFDENEVDEKLPSHVKRLIADNDIKLYIINATEIAHRLGLGSHTNTVLQAAFFKISKLMDVDKALEHMKEAARKAYFAKGSKVVNMNVEAIDEGAKNVIEIKVPASWKECTDEREPDDPNLPPVVRNILFPINRQKGDDLPVSTFKGYEDGTIDVGLTAYEKRAIAVNVPEWDSSKCLQCNQCSFVCPHAAIRPYIVTKEEAKNAPKGFDTVKLNGIKDTEYEYRLEVSKHDCTGCGSCVASCPAKEKAIKMVPAKFSDEDLERWNYALSLSDKGDLFNPNTVKGSQFRTPLVEFSAACAGCGETPYAKLLTQLFGDRVYWANATGCSQAWGAPMPGIPYTTNKRGFGPAWTNSLFENNAELALGMYLSSKQQREGQKNNVIKLLEMNINEELKDKCNDWLDTFDDLNASRVATDNLIEELEKVTEGKHKELCDKILRAKDQLSKKTLWMYGGDGWAYDIGFGGLNHVIAQGENVNILIVDTEVYSNTGGQSSKATPIGAVAQFQASGKKSRKMDLGAIMMSYGNVYVAQVAMGANQTQLVKAITEAESYDGPSVIIAYAPCTTHGIRSGMGSVQAEMKKAVESGYWYLYRYDPRKEVPMQLDSKEPNIELEEFLDGENRYSVLKKTFPENAKELFAIAKTDSRNKYEKYKKMTE
ncbi:MAG: pyruvate:ferredoxin (flavodoxin) oxidoreductase [Lachnospiraceae bacterium]|nr:pyruvate:ferredoxin (flavodoxin) oxidoreductase [Lachnospiraceae bacterium]MCI6978443.1 pyruvate:ferredoxin (flavodoxin) oxidoreductase [Lachnospiraceae bacterium]MDY4837600.1 pyruvate:ferredoxin (flavodoxin) oxidoreductase [Lachnospiraceae bacterium]MDY5215887.1 pyruvate:ferredoxin (flavodoxin) oxidoreductase [Lachnospiraceae bacterium]MDY5639855.1 pyruvate:ferredoxin (flavodoxin) oxidoreductase [Lachnospiraceae bacterium]